MNAISKLIELVRHDENLQRQSYPLQVCELAATEVDNLQKIVKIARSLQARLDEHFGGDPSNDWKEQAELRALLQTLKVQDQLEAK